MALFTPSRNFSQRLAEMVRPDLRRREKALNAALTRLAKSNAGKPLPVIERAVDRATNTAGVTLDRDTRKKVAMLIHLGGGA